MAGNAGAYAALEGMIVALRSLRGIAQEAAPEVAETLVTAVRTDLAAGRDPGTGQAWSLTKKGEQAMKGAAAALTHVVSGTKIVLSMAQPYVFHHFGVRGEDRRRVLPEGQGMPAKLGDAIRLGFVKPFRKAFGKG